MDGPQFKLNSPDSHRAESLFGVRDCQHNRPIVISSDVSSQTPIFQPREGVLKALAMTPNLVRRHRGVRLDEELEDLMSGFTMTPDQSKAIEEVFLGSFSIGIPCFDAHPRNKKYGTTYGLVDISERIKNFDLERFYRDYLSTLEPGGERLVLSSNPNIAFEWHNNKPVIIGGRALLSNQEFRRSNSLVGKLADLANLRYGITEERGPEPGFIMDIPVDCLYMYRLNNDNYSFFKDGSNVDQLRQGLAGLSSPGQCMKVEDGSPLAILRQCLGAEQDRSKLHVRVVEPMLIQNISMGDLNKHVLPGILDPVTIPLVKYIANTWETRVERDPLDDKPMIVMSGGLDDDLIVTNMGFGRDNVQAQVLQRIPESTGIEKARVGTAQHVA